MTTSAPSSSKSDKTVPSHMKKSNLFYRRIYKTTIQALGQDYAKGNSSTSHTKDAGDFAPEGVDAFYVFDNEQEALDWGRCHTEGTAIKTYVIGTHVASLLGIASQLRAFATQLPHLPRLLIG
ncbi:unnamed protein product [Adineta ricciae]|uniref:Uncharacterized protein n=1 Tax=Adineta ricciae TaxID=249248 RepID=A0A815UUT1_ADIRI|nr:unnamed protein product [Adineta ricciae]